MRARDVMVIAHRGASSYAPENTLAAFDLALQMGVRDIELDVHATRDDHIVVIHDEGVDRTTNGSGPVAQGRAHIHTEIKGHSADLAKRTVELIRRHGMVAHVTITSFQRARLEETRVHAPELPTGWLVAAITDAVIAQARAMGLTQLCPRANTVTPELVDRLRRAGFVVRAWGVADEDLMRAVVKAGADGMTVNFPDKLIAHLTGGGGLE